MLVGFWGTKGNVGKVLCRAKATGVGSVELQVKLEFL
jgi:hypothetical protein